MIGESIRERFFSGIYNELEIASSYLTVSIADTFAHLGSKIFRICQWDLNSEVFFVKIR